MTNMLPFIISFVSSSLDSNNPEVGTLGHILVTNWPMISFSCLSISYERLSKEPLTASSHHITILTLSFYGWCDEQVNGEGLERSV